MSINSSKGARRRKARRSAGGRRRTLAGLGDGWDLWIPEDVWARMTDQERAAAAEQQRALLEPSPASTRPPRRSAIVAGVLDQMTTARPAQLPLFG